MDEKLMDDRKQTHGAYHEYAMHEQALRELFHSVPNWEAMTATQRSVLENIAGKLARILTGSPHHIDTWRDIQGYAQRAIEELSKMPGATDDKVHRVMLIDGEWQ